MPRRLLSLCALLVMISLASARADDPIEDKLEKAKAAHAAEFEKFQKDVTTWFEKREEAARKVGDKKVVDQILAERKAFEERGEVPVATPKVTRQRLSMARTTLEKAFETAIKEYTKAKNDDAAASTEKALDGFKKERDPSDVRRKWVHGKGSYTLQTGGVWEEKSPDGNAYKWKEVSRTKTYVELHIDLGGTSSTVRLTDTSADYLAGKDTFKKTFFGKWAD